MIQIPQAPISDYKILLMPSGDGFPYATACLIPKDMTTEAADALLGEVTTSMNDEEQDGEGDSWEWEEMVHRLEPHGFVFLDFERGKVQWDHDCTSSDESEA